MGHRAVHCRVVGSLKAPKEPLNPKPPPSGSQWITSLFAQLDGQPCDKCLGTHTLAPRAHSRRRRRPSLSKGLSLGTLRVPLSIRTRTETFTCSCLWAVSLSAHLQFRKLGWHLHWTLPPHQERAITTTTTTATPLTITNIFDYDNDEDKRPPRPRSAATRTKGRRSRTARRRTKIRSQP